jgi:serine/threonine-protein kinase
MPYVEGESLREKMDREKQLAISDAVEIARNVASALDYAHRQGVIHRDIKPENVLMHDGQPLVADFGIALAVSHAGGTRLTETGLSIGTPYYMSPEQAMGDRELDGRSDLYSLGAMLYEMLTGDPPYTGSTAQAIVAKVITERPSPVTRARETVPAHVTDAVMKCLEKLPADRFPTAARFGDALADPSFRTGLAGTDGEAAVAGSRSRAVPILAAAVAVFAALAAVGWMRGPAASEDGVSRFVLTLPESAQLLYFGGPSMSLSPDGRRLVYHGWSGDNTEPAGLFVRHLDRVAPEAIPGTERAYSPFFSPDGQWIAFFEGSSLRKMPVQGGAAITLTETVANFGGGAWLDDGTIVYHYGEGGLARIDENGGVHEVVYEPADHVGEFYGPMPVPGRSAVVGSRCLDVGCSTYEVASLDLESGEMVTLVPNAAGAWVLPTGQFLYAMEDGAVFAQPFDDSDLTLTGAPVPVLGGLRVINASAGGVTFSRNGTLVYLGGDAGIESQLVMVDKAGNERAITSQLRDYVSPRFSPDGRQLVVELHDDQGNGHLWIYDIASETLSRLTYDGHDGRQRWSPDGRTIVFSSNAEGGWKGFTVPADGSARPTLAIDTEYFVRSKTWTPDSRTVVFHSEDDGDIGFALYRWDVGTDAEPQRIAQTVAREWSPALSRDGAWLAYTSDESGRDEIYVRSFENPTGRYAVSTDGGRQALWGNGTELFYRSRDGFYMAELEFEPTFRVLSRTRLFDDSDYAEVRRAVGYDVHPDGEQFVFVKQEESANHPVVVLNWFDELEALGVGSN